VARDVANRLPRPWVDMIVWLRRDYRLMPEEITERLRVRIAPSPAPSLASSWSRLSHLESRAARAAMQSRARRVCVCSSNSTSRSSPALDASDTKDSAGRRSPDDRR
jgi:hypothetical protein